MKIATRYLLPLEMFMSLVMLSWGIAGWSGGGTLCLVLERTGQNAEWGLALTAVGAVQLVACAFEWCLCRRWPGEHLLRIIYVRHWSAFVSAAVWLYALYVVATLPQAGHMLALVLQSIAAMAASVWICAENLKAACLLDPTVPTTRLARAIEIEREDHVHLSPH